MPLRAIAAFGKVEVPRRSGSQETCPRCVVRPRAGCTDGSARMRLC